MQILKMVIQGERVNLQSEDATLKELKIVANMLLNTVKVFDLWQCEDLAIDLNSCLPPGFDLVSEEEEDVYIKI